MKHSLIGLGLVMAIPVSVAMAAEAEAEEPVSYLLQSPGAECQPAEPQYAKYIDYLDGSAMAHADVVLSCPLPAAPPDFRKISVTVSLVDLHRAWGKQACRAFNLYGGTTGASPIVPISGREHLAEAFWSVDPRDMVPHAVVCEVRAGQRLYGIQVEVAPL